MHEHTTQGEVHAALRKTESGYSWAVVYDDRIDTVEIVSRDHANLDAAKSAAFAFAQAHGARFIPTRRMRA